MIGELINKYPKESGKKLGICLRGDRLLPHLHPKAGLLAEAYLKERGVEIHKNHSYSGATPGQLGYDYTIECLGQKYDPYYLKKNFP